MTDDRTRLRLSHADRAIVRAEGGDPGVVAFVGRVLTSTPARGKFLLVQPVTVTGNEVEGATGTLTDQGDPVLVEAWCDLVPAQNDLVHCWHTGYRWVTCGTRSAVVTSPCSPCGMPHRAITLTFHFESSTGIISPITETYTLNYRAVPVVTSDPFTLGSICWDSGPGLQTSLPWLCAESGGYTDMDAGPSGIRWIWLCRAGFIALYQIATDIITVNVYGVGFRPHVQDNGTSILFNPNTQTNILNPRGYASQDVTMTGFAGTCSPLNIAKAYQYSDLTTTYNWRATLT